MIKFHWWKVEYKANIKHFDARHATFALKYPAGQSRKKACPECKLVSGTLPVWTVVRLALLQELFIIVPLWCQIKYKKGTKWRTKMQCNIFPSLWVNQQMWAPYPSSVILLGTLQVTSVRKAVFPVKGWKSFMESLLVFLSHLVVFNI